MFRNLAPLLAFAFFFCPLAAKPPKKPAPQYSQIPAWFEPNLGQAPAEVLFLSRKSGVTLALMANHVVFETNSEQIRLTPLDANPSPAIKGLAPEKGQTNYLKSSDPSQWLTSVPHYGRVVYESVYKGIDLMYYPSGQQYEFDLVVNPEADPSRIAFQIAGARSMRIEANGDLVLKGSKSTLRLHKPVIYQPNTAGPNEILGGFVLRGNVVRFRIGPYDRTQALIIDPLATSSYLGGRDVDIATSVTNDTAGSYYITGYTTSTDFLRSGGTPYKSTLTPGDGDAFVAKLNAAGTSILYITYLGGPNADAGRAIAVDSTGAAYITGSTIGQFPTTVGAFRQVTTVSPTIFVAKLNASGSGLVYATYLDGAGAGQSIQVDSAGSAYVAGFTYSAAFTTTPAGFQRLYGGATDAFVTKLDANGATEVYSTFIGGSGEDQATDLRIDSSGAAYIAGFTGSPNFPTVAGSYRTSLTGGVDGFLTKLNAAGGALHYSTFLGGSGEDRAWGLAVDAAGNAYVTGQTSSSGFPTTPGAYQRTFAGTSDIFVTKFNATGTALAYSTLLGGSPACTVSDPFSQYPCDTGRAIVVDSNGQASITGVAGSGLPLVSPDQPTAGGSGDAFLSQFNAAGSALLYSSFVGGGAADMGLGLVAGSTTPMIVGFTRSADFPVTNGAVQTANGGGTTEGFFTRYGGTCAFSLSPTSSFFPNNAGTYSVTLTAPAGCPWTATANSNWITVTTASGVGPGSITYSVTANPDGLRVGQITVGNATFTLSQVGGACVITLGYTSSWFPQGAAFYPLPVFTSRPDCTWTATTSTFWISVTFPTEPGVGNGNAYFFLNTNSNSLARTGTVDVNGQTVTINQVGAPAPLTCGFSLSKQADSLDSYGGSSSLLVSSTTGCQWSTVNPYSWITITAGFAGSGEGVVGYTVSPNASNQARIGQITVAGQPVTIFQSGR